MSDSNSYHCTGLQFECKVVDTPLPNALHNMLSMYIGGPIHPRYQDVMDLFHAIAEDSMCQTFGWFCLHVGTTLPLLYHYQDGHIVRVGRVSTGLKDVPFYIYAHI